jgi:hypothetical protein
MVPRLRTGQADDAETLILKAIDQKGNKGGAAYAAGKTLIVFLDAGAVPGFQTGLRGDCPIPCISRPCGSSACKGLRRASMSAA